MKNEIIKRNILITFLTSIIFVLLSFFIMSYTNKLALEEEIVNAASLFTSYVGENNTDETIIIKSTQFTLNQDWINICIARKDGILIFDSLDDSIGTLINNISLTDSEITIASKLIDNDRIITENNNIYYYLIIDNYIVKFSATYNVSTNYILLSIFVMLILLIIEIGLSYILSNKTSNNVLKVFSNIEANLENINSSNYDSKSLNGVYEEVEPIVKEINKINNNLNNSFIKLENERNKLLLVVNKLNEGIIILDDSLNIILINDAASLILQIEKDKSIGSEFKKHIDSKKYINEIKKTLENKESRTFDYKNLNNSRIYQVNSNYLSINWESLGEIKNVIFITLNDVTVDRRASLVKSNFISNASHELKTPITSIKGFVELLGMNSSLLDDKNKRYIDIIKNESNRMSELIDELIYLSKIEEMDKDEAKEVIYFKDITEDIISSLINNNPLNITFTNSCDDSYINANPILIYRLLKNLIENAFKYNKLNGSVDINTYKDNNNVILVVKDTGIGIEQKDLDRIFERFYRVDKSRSSLIEGTGLGLNIVKETCELLNAKLSVESIINQGTIFKIIFTDILEK